MGSNKKKSKRQSYKIEIVTVFAIACCLLSLIYFADTKLDEIIASDREALLMEHDPTDPLHEALAQSITDFRPDACKMIEVYSEELKPIFRIQFREDDEHTNDELSEYPDLVKLLKNNEDGHTQVTINDEEEDVYFRWTETVDGDKRLVIIYMSRPIVHNIWVFHMICYIILGLVCFLLLRLQLRNHKEKIEYYRKTSMDVRDRLIR